MSDWHLSPSVLRSAGVPGRLRERVRKHVRFREPDEKPVPIVIASAADVLGTRQWRPPADAGGPDTRYLVLANVPEPAILALASAFDLRRPEIRMHVTRDPKAVHRLLIAQLRDEPAEGIVDAYVLFTDLVLTLGDLTIRRFPVKELPDLNPMPERHLLEFEIDEDGSFLYWPHADLHLGASQLLQAVNPAYLADVEIKRFASSSALGHALAALRESKGLRQSDIPRLSERQVRRIEQGVSRFSSSSAAKFAEAFGVPVTEFLDHLAVAVESPGPAGAPDQEEELVSTA